MPLNARLAILLSDVPFIEPLNNDLPELQPIIRTGFWLTIAELDSLLRISNSLSDLQANCVRQHWSLVPVHLLTQQLAELENEYGISLFSTDSDVSVLKPPRQFSVLSVNGADVINTLFANIDQKLLLELVEQHLIGEARHGYLDGISATKAYWKKWDDQVELPPNFQWHTKLQHSTEIRKPEFVIGEKRTNPVHLIRWQLILEWLTNRVNLSLIP